MHKHDKIYRGNGLNDCMGQIQSDRGIFNVRDSIKIYEINVVL